MKIQYLAIPKTGSISMRNYCKHNAISILWHGRDQKFLQHNLYDCDIVFTTLRDPVTRVISAYYFLKQGGKNTLDKKEWKKYCSQYSDINEFIKKGLSRAQAEQIHFFSQYTWLCNTEGRILYQKIKFLKFENLENDLDNFTEEFQLQTFKLSHENTSIKDDIELDPESLEIIRKVYRKDYLLMIKIGFITQTHIASLHKKSTVLMLTHNDHKTGLPLVPHVDWLEKTNPSVNIEIVVGEDSAYGKEYNWKNGDQPLRKWWKENGDRITSEIIYIVEWDTLITCELPRLPDNFDLVGKQVIRENPSIRGNWKIKPMKHFKWKDENWYWWPDIPKLGLQESEIAVGLISFGCLITRKSVLNALCHEKWDSIYEKNIQNELRFPTVAHLGGARIGEIDLPFVDHGRMKYHGTPGIYHPIKKEVKIQDTNMLSENLQKLLNRYDLYNFLFNSNIVTSVKNILKKSYHLFDKNYTPKDKHKPSKYWL